MFSFVLVSHPSCAVFRYFTLDLAPVLSVFVCVFLYWVRPLVMLLTLGTFDGCAILAHHQILTSVRESEVKKNSLRGFLGVLFRAKLGIGWQKNKRYEYQYNYHTTFVPGQTIFTFLSKCLPFSPSFSLKIFGKASARI